tara:strand:- start:2319 stop:3230 length:912 start_codon:yes stop_codon:yes gene_type:complete
MVVTIIDDMISSENVTVAPGTFEILYRKINLQRGMCRRLKQVDVFDDIDFFGQRLNYASLSYQMTISTFPIVYNEMPFLDNANSMPYAGERHILYKTQGYQDENGNRHISEYPSPEIAALDDVFFFAPHLYLTLYIYNSPESEAPITIPKLNFSVYCSLEDKKVDRVQYDIGVYQEYLSMMSANELSTGSMMQAANNAGYFAPSWRYGGKRSSLMASVAAFTANTTSMFLPEGPNEAQEMERRGDIQQTLERSRTMVPYDEPFGQGSAPDWFRFNIGSGIVSGPLRDQSPPTKYADNGNTLML